MQATQRDLYGGSAALSLTLPEPQRAAANANGDAVAEGDEALLDQATKQVFAAYACKSVTRGRPHPGDIAEASSLA